MQDIVLQIDGKGLSPNEWFRTSDGGSQPFRAGLLDRMQLRDPKQPRNDSEWRGL